jgi:hypothetical protein
MKILVLILASDNQPIYIEFQKLWRLYMNTNIHFDCYFYKGNPRQAEKAILTDKNTLSLRIRENMKTIWDKTLMALDYFSDKLDEYDFVFRTNLSSFLRFDKYLETTYGWPKENFCCALTGPHPDMRFPKGYVIFPSGAGFTLSVDLVKRLIQERPQRFFQDDVTVGWALERWGIGITEAPRITILHEEEVDNLEGIINMEENKDVYHYRVKNIHWNRELDLKAHEYLIKRFYS